MRKVYPAAGWILPALEYRQADVEITVKEIGWVMAFFGNYIFYCPKAFVTGKARAITEKQRKSRAE